MAGQQRSSSGRPLARGAKRDALPALAGDPILERLDAQLTSGTAGQGMSTGGSDTPSKTCRRWATFSQHRRAFALRLLS